MLLGVDWLVRHVTFVLKNVCMQINLLQQAVPEVIVS